MNAITFCYENIDFRIWEDNILAAWIESSVKNEDNDIGHINFIFCADDYLYEMNKKYLKHETLTAVITFDFCEVNVISGVIFISIDRVRENGKKFKVRFENELARVMIHGVLHLVGYGDKNEDEKKLMTEMENHYLSKLYVSHETSHLQNTQKA